MHTSSWKVHFLMKAYYLRSCASENNSAKGEAGKGEPTFKQAKVKQAKVKQARAKVRAEES